MVAIWLPVRLLWSRQATAARRLLADGCPLEIFAHRAVARAPLPALPSARQRTERS